jgi:uncharacterized membrane protein
VLEFIATLPPEFHVLAVAAIPVIELRGAIPLGIHLGLPPLEAMALAVAGNLAPIPLLYYVLLPAVSYLKGTGLFRRLVTSYVARSERESRRIKRYGLPGLILFVSIPLPVTGAWTGCLIALLLGYSLGRTMLALALGTLVAGTIVTTLARLAVG